MTHYELVEVDGAERRVVAREFSLRRLLEAAAVQDAADAEQERELLERAHRNRAAAEKRYGTADLLALGKTGEQVILEDEDGLARLAKDVGNGALHVVPRLYAPARWDEEPRFVFGAFSAAPGPVLPPEDTDYDAPLIVEGPAVTVDPPVDDEDIHNAEFLAARDDLDDDGPEPTALWEGSPGPVS